MQTPTRRLPWLPALLATFAFGAAAAPPPSAAPPPWPATKESPAAAAVDPTRPLMMGAQRVVLDSTAIVGLRAAIGAGTIVHQGSGTTDALDWLCFTVPDAASPQRVWLASSELARGRIDGVTALELPAGSAATEACPELPAKFRPVRFDDGLWLGALGADVKKGLGIPARGVPLFTTLFHGQNGNLDVVGTIAIEFRNGRAAAIHVAHSSQN